VGLTRPGDLAEGRRGGTRAWCPERKKKPFGGKGVKGAGRDFDHCSLLSDGDRSTKGDSFFWGRNAGPKKVPGSGSDWGGKSRSAGAGYRGRPFGTPEETRRRKRKTTSQAQRAGAERKTSPKILGGNGVP